MRIKGLSWAALAAASVLSACGDAGMTPELNDTPSIDPGRLGPELSLASDRYSDWSDPMNLGPVINSGFNDQQPALSKKGLALYFASNRPTGPSDNVLDQNIWVARRACTEACPWGRPQVLPIVNTEFLDVSPTLSRDEHQLFFASQRPHNHCSGAPPCTNRDLWVSYRENVHDDFGWQPALNLGDGINSPEEEVAPSYFENEDAGAPQLFFNRGDVTGDIYASQMVNGVWGLPAPVAEINSSIPSDADQRPSISHDGRELYFWSNRRGGVAHLWVATRRSVSDSWSDPVLVPSPISDEPTLMPFIHSHGKTEILLFVRPFTPATARDLWMSQRTRSGGSEQTQ
jgi:hypothetical protein